MAKISAVIITYNEDKNIEKTLEAVRWCDEIVIVDSGSTDNTMDICKRFGCKIFSHPFEGYGPQKIYAVSLALNDWILSIDADEVVSENLAKEIHSIFQNNSAAFVGFYIPISLVFLGRQFRYGSEARKPSLRLFNRKFGNFTPYQVHEKVAVQGGTRLLKHKILHYSYSNIHQYFNKFNDYTTYGAKQLYAKNRKVSILYIVFHLPFTFLKYYILKGSVLNGVPGLEWSLFSSFSPVVKYFKLQEIYKKQIKK